MTLGTVDRLRSGRDIAAVFQGSRQRSGRFLVVHARGRGDDQPARLAVVASRRVGGAVERNRAKRLIREAARRVAWRRGFDVVIVARRACAQSRLSAIDSELSTLAGRLSLSGNLGG